MCMMQKKRSVVARQQFNLDNNIKNGDYHNDSSNINTQEQNSQLR